MYPEGDFGAESISPRPGDEAGDGASLAEGRGPRAACGRSGRAGAILAMIGGAALALFLNLGYYFVCRNYPAASLALALTGCALAASALILIGGLILGIRAVAVAKDRGAWCWIGIAVSVLSLIILVGLAVLVYTR